MNPRVLIIEDKTEISRALEILFKINDIDSASAQQPEVGLQMLQSDEFDVVIQDMNFHEDTTSGEEGIRLFHQIKAIHPEIPVILLTAWTHLETAVELMKAGAADYLSKPWDDQKLLVSVNNLAKLSKLERQHHRAVDRRQQKKAELTRKYDLCDICFESEEMLNLVLMATKVAGSDAPILISGPNGSGKEKIAEIIQANSSCSDQPFIRVNMGAIPEDLIEAELFGAEAGAYTGVKESRHGRFEAADGGTLFLDEIGNLSLKGQQKLLRALQTGESQRLGTSHTVKVDVRVITATNTDLLEAVHKGTFREDLYYRINVIELEVPALADRRDDILPLAERFLPEGYELSDQARDRMVNYDWPGNVRQLQNVIKRASLLSPAQTITVNDLGLDRYEQTANVSDDLDKDEIVRALKGCKGVVSKAARELGISRQALYRRIEKLDLEHLL